MKQYVCANRLFAFAIFGYAIYFQNTSPNPVRQQPFGFFKYLTYWNLLLQFSYFNFTLIIQCWFQLKKFDKLISTWFYSLSLPLGTFVSFAFWYLKLFQNEMLFPPGVKDYFPIWHQHCTHTVVLICPLIELFLTNHRVPSPKVGLFVLSTFMASYGMTIAYYGLAYRIWAYPFLATLTWPERLTFAIICHVLCIGVYFSATCAARYKSGKLILRTSS